MRLQTKQPRRAVYLDHAATTPLDPGVQKALWPFLQADFANPSALYPAGVASREAVETARAKCAEALFTQPRNIIFTSGGTESNNLAILGLIDKEPKTKKKLHIITTAIEHHSVLYPVRALAKQGIEVTYLPVNAQGEISLKELMAAIRPETILISIMYANNEIGTINPIAEIGREILKYRKQHHTAWPYFHTDACQAASSLDLSVERLHVDLLTLNGSKVYGPKGSGLLFVRPGTPLAPHVYGGDQEFGLRSGTENVPTIVGLGAALHIIAKKKQTETTREENLRNYFWKTLHRQIPNTKLNGPQLEVVKNLRAPKKWQEVVVPRLANNLNVQFPGIEGETLVLYLGARGIAAATGSACASNSLEASHVLVACGLTVTEAQSSVRFSLGHSTTKADIDYTVKAIVNTLALINKTTRLHA